MKFHFYIPEESGKQYLQTIFSSLRYVLSREKQERLKAMRQVWDSLCAETVVRKQLRLCDIKYDRILIQQDRNRLHKAFLSLRINNENNKLVLCENAVAELKPFKIEAEQDLQDEIDHTDHERLH
jgi:hypothetical protein